MEQLRRARRGVLQLEPLREVGPAAEVTLENSQSAAELEAHRHRTCRAELFFVQPQRLLAADALHPLSETEKRPNRLRPHAGPPYVDSTGVEDALERAQRLIASYDAELRRELPPGSEVFDAHVHLGNDIDGMAGSYEELTAQRSEEHTSELQSHSDL